MRARLAGSAVTLVIVLGVALTFVRGDDPPGDTGEFGLLPQPVDGSLLSQRPGPGRVTYEFAGDFELPHSARAYRLIVEEGTAELTRTIAARLGLSGSASRVDAELGAPEGYRVGPSSECNDVILRVSGSALPASSRSDCVAVTSVTVGFDGSLWFRAGDVPTDGPPRDFDAAQQAARAWIEMALPGGDFDLKAASSRCTPRCRAFVARPRLPMEIVSGEPALVISVGDDGRVESAIGTWSTPGESAEYRLLPWNGVRRSLVEHGTTFEALNIAAGDSADRLRDATIQVTAVEVALSGGVTAGGGHFLVPVYVIEGQLTQDGLPAPVAFAAWIPATEAIDATRAPTVEPTPEPSLTTGNWDDVLASLPVPEGAEYADATRGATIVQQFTTGMPPEAILAYYDAAIAAREWARESSSEGFLSYTRDGLRLSVRVNLAAGVTQFELEVGPAE